MRSGVFPCSTMLATSGTCAGTAARTWSISIDGLRRLDEHRVGSRVGERAGATHGLVESRDGAGVGARGDVKRRALARAKRGAQLGQVLVERDDPLALHVAAALRPLLVFQEAAGGAEAQQLRHACARR